MARFEDTAKPAGRMAPSPIGRSVSANPGEERGPGWAIGLRRLYDGVACERMPADLDDLLARLQGRSDGRSPGMSPTVGARPGR